MTQTNRPMDKWTDRQTDRQTDRPMNKGSDRHTVCKQTDRQTGD